MSAWEARSRSGRRAGESCSCRRWPITTITVNWGNVPYTNGYEVDASTAEDFTGTLYVSSTSINTATGGSAP